MSYKLNDQNQILVWKSLFFDKVSSQNLARIIIQNTATIFEEFIQIGPLQGIAAIQTDKATVQSPHK